MSEHFARGLAGEKTTAWCESCRRLTEHLIVPHTEHAARLGHCVDPGHRQPEGLSKEQEKRRREQEQEKRNPRLF